MKASNLRPLWDQCRRLVPSFTSVTFVHIPRAQNALADSLANDGVDSTAVLLPSPAAPLASSRMYGFARARAGGPRADVARRASDRSGPCDGDGTQLPAAACGWREVVARVKAGVDLDSAAIRAGIRRLAEAELNPRQLRAFNAIAVERKNVFVTGNAGPSAEGVVGVACGCQAGWVPGSHDCVLAGAKSDAARPPPTHAAGTGKTHLLNLVVAYLKQRDGGVAITASTGIAACHVGGVTLHSWAGCGVPVYTGA